MLTSRVKNLILLSSTSRFSTIAIASIPPKTKMIVKTALDGKYIAIAIVY